MGQLLLISFGLLAMVSAAFANGCGASTDRDCNQVFHVGKWRSFDNVDVCATFEEADMTNEECKALCRARENCVYAFFEELLPDNRCQLVTSAWQQNAMYDAPDTQQLIKLSDCDEHPVCPQDSTRDCNQRYYVDETVENPPASLCEFPNVFSNGHCKAHCRKHPDCKYAIYNTNVADLTCTLYDGKFKKNMLIDEPGFIVVKLSQCTPP